MAYSYEIIFASISNFDNKTTYAYPVPVISSLSGGRRHVSSSSEGGLGRVCMQSVLIYGIPNLIL